MPGGKFITLEGGEGAGKTTQIALLKAKLEVAGHAVTLTREPGGAPGAELIRDLLVKGDTDRWDGMSEALMMTAARVEHVRTTIKPALERGEWVISDRFFDSTIAYQGAARGLGIQEMWDLQKLALGDFAPDATIILDQPVEIGLGRAKGREEEAESGEDRFERMDLSFHETLRQAFIDIASMDQARCAVINANQVIDAVHSDIWAAVKARVGL